MKHSKRDRSDKFFIELLKDSFYYPACELDGGAVKFLSRQFSTFVYCDYNIPYRIVDGHLDTFLGYKLIELGNLSRYDLLNKSWPKVHDLPFPIMDMKYMDRRRVFKIERPFILWARYKRLPKYKDDFGSDSFNLIYISGEGVLTYYALYWLNEITPKGVGIIQPGTGSGGNWTDFTDPNSYLGHLILRNPAGQPDTIARGGIGSSPFHYLDFNWPGFQKGKEYDNYYGKGSGRVVLWRKRKASDKYKI